MRQVNDFEKTISIHNYNQDDRRPSTPDLKGQIDLQDKELSTISKVDHVSHLRGASMDS